MLQTLSKWESFLLPRSFIKDLYEMKERTIEDGRERARRDYVDDNSIFYNKKLHIALNDSFKTFFSTCCVEYTS